VGPTHDDVTFEGVARAFDLPLERHPALLQLLESYGLPRNEATLRMAMVPQGSELLAHETLSVPVVHIRKVYVLPGVPRLMQNKFEVIAARFSGPEVHTARLYVDQHEWEFADRLTEVAKAHPTVDIGSYPRFGEGPYKVIVTLEARDSRQLDSARAHFLSAVRTVDPATGC
jgi:molybdopterin-biosynthesis enzyme MoeA-like protein